MSNLKLLSKILRLMGMKITNYAFKHRDEEEKGPGSLFGQLPC